MTQKTNKFLILDNVLSKEEIDNILFQNSHFKNSTLYSLDEINFLKPLINIASKYYNFNKCLGYEVWSHANSQPKGWFVEKDDTLPDNKKFKYPICSILYYLIADDVDGGELNLENEIVIPPQNNRLVLFDPGFMQMFNLQYSGSLITIHINPWDKKIGI